MYDRGIENIMSRRKQSNPKPIKRPEDEEEETSEVNRKTDQSGEEKDMETNQSDPGSETEQDKEPMEMEDTKLPPSEEEGSPQVEVKEELISDNESKEENEKQESERNSPVVAEMSPQRQEVMKKLNFPADLLTLQKVKEDEFLQTGIPWSISTSVALTKGTSMGPYEGEMVSLSSVKPGQLVLQFQTTDGDLTFIKVTEDAGAWLSLLKPADLTSTHNTKVYFEGTRIWCEIEKDIEVNTELIASFTTDLPTETSLPGVATPNKEPEDRNTGTKKTESKPQLSPQPVLRYGCPFCGVRFSSPRTLEGHLTYYCSKKPPDFISLQDLQQRLQKQAEQSMALLEKQSENQSRLEQDSTSPNGGLNVRLSPKGQKRSVDEAQMDSSDSPSDSENPRSKVLKVNEHLKCSVCDLKMESLVSLQAHMKTHGNNVQKVLDPERLSVSPQCQEEMCCKECNIQFSSLKTYYGHKEFYCRFNQAKKNKGEDDIGEASTATMRNLTASDLSPKSLRALPAGIDASMLLASSKAVLPPGILIPGLLQSSLLLQTMSKDFPHLMRNSHPTEAKLSPPGTIATDIKQNIKSAEDQPLDLSKNKTSKSSERVEPDSGQESPTEKESLIGVKSESESPPLNNPPQTMKLRTIPEKLVSSIGQSPLKTPLNIPTILPTFITNAQTQFVNKKPIPPLQSVSRCVECNIVFYKHENYLIHKEHYCSGRRMKEQAGDSSNSDSDMKSPDCVRKSPDNAELADTNGRNANKTHKVDETNDVNRLKANEVCYKYFCIPCKIKFSSAGTLKAHKEFYCPNGKENDANVMIKDKSGEQKMPGSSDMGNYRCEMCKNEFMSARLLKLHICMGEVAAAPLLRCLYCDYVTQTENRLSEHIKVHVPTKAFKCNICGYRGNTARGMRMHGKMHVENGEEFTDDNMIEFEEPPLVPIQRNGACEKGPIDMETELIRMKNEPYKRRRSRKSFEKSENMVPFLSQNLLTQICAACGQTFTNVSDFVIHLRMHEIAALEAMKNMKTLRCEHCNDYVADSLTSLLVHMQSKHPEQLPGTSKSEHDPVSGSEYERSQSRDSDLSNERSRSNSVESSRTSKSSSSQSNHVVSRSHSPQIKSEKAGNDQTTTNNSKNNLENDPICVVKQEISDEQLSDMNGNTEMEDNRSKKVNDLEDQSKSPTSLSQNIHPHPGSQSQHSHNTGSSSNGSSPPTSPRMETSTVISPGQKVRLAESPSATKQQSSPNSLQESLVSPKIQSIKQEKMSPKQMSPDPKTRYLMSQNIMNIKQERTSPPIKSPHKTPPPSSPTPNSILPKIPSVPFAANSAALQSLPFIYNPQAMLSLYHLPGVIPSSLNATPGSPTSPGLSNGGEKNGRKYCKHCDINFTYLSSFLTHKKYYCSARNSTEESQSPTATA